MKNSFSEQAGKVEVGQGTDPDTLGPRLVPAFRVWGVSMLLVRILQEDLGLSAYWGEGLLTGF